MNYVQNFLCKTEAKRLLDWSLDATCVAWQQEQFTLFGRQVDAPRRLAWFGDANVNYRYTGIDHVASGWPQLLKLLRERVESIAGTRFNFVLCNRYDDGAQYMGWHRDDEAQAGPVIASLSLGATRRFRYRQGPGSSSEFVELAHGSVLVFDGRIQHMLTRTKRTVGTRINMTFRQIAACS